MKKKKIWSLLLAASLLTTSIGPVYANEEDIQTNQEAVNNGIEELKNAKIEFKVNADWGTGFNGEITITNTSSETIHDWCLKFESDYEFLNIWNGVIVCHEAKLFKIKNCGWNQDILPGEIVSFGFSAEGSFNSYPKNYELLGEMEPVSEEECSISYDVISDWGSGFIGRVVITNNTESVIEDWCLSSKFDNSIVSIWGGEISSQKDTQLVINNVGYNQNIAPGASIEIGFNVEGTSTNKMTDFKLTSINCEALNEKEFADFLTVSTDSLLYEEGNYYLTESYNGFSGKIENDDKIHSFVVTVYDKNDILVYQSDIEPLDAWSTGEIGLAYGVNKVVFKAETAYEYDCEELTINCLTSEFMNMLNVDYEDNDEDGLCNYYEDYFGTDKDDFDTEDDGLSDYIELYYGYNAFVEDTDDDGICDAEEDLDEDGLANGIEIELGSSIFDYDSDNDRLEDKVELEFGTSPIIEDTDNDGISDYKEYQLKDLQAFYDEATGTYTVEFAADDMITNYDETVIPTIKLTADAEGILNFNIERVESDYLLNASMAGYIGAAYDFTTSGTMQGAELTFTYDESLIDSEMLNSEEFCPTIYYYNPEDNSLTEVEGQVWSGNQVKVNLTHFSRYILVNKADIEALWSQTVDIGENVDIATSNEVVFVIDKSGSMSWNDPNSIRAKLLRDFCNRMDSDDKFGLIGFINGSINYTGGLISDKEEIESSIAAFERQMDTSGTYLNAAMNDAVEMLEASEDTANVRKSIFVLTDGYTMDTLSHQFLDQIKEQNITVYVVGLGDVDETYLRTIATTTGGDYFYAEMAEDLSDTFEEFESAIQGQDENDDDLNDELTKLICQGEITTITGTKVFDTRGGENAWEIVYNDVMKSSDLDEDGLKNGEEISIYYIGEKPYIKFNTDPEKVDTDYDFISDYDEVKQYGTDPRVSNYIVDSKDLLYVNQFENFESGKAFEEYLDRNNVAITAEYIFNVVVLGGEANVNKIVRRELLDYFASYTEEKQEELTFLEWLNGANDYVRGICDVLPAMELGLEKFYINQTINNYQKQIIELYKAPNSKGYKNALKKEMSALDKKFSDHYKSFLKNKYSTKLDNIGKYAGFAITIASCGLECWDEYTEYVTLIETLDNYENVLNKLMYCGNENIEQAAKILDKDMSNVEEKYKTAGADLRSTVYSAFSSGAEGFLIAKYLGLPGVVIDLVWLASEIIVDDALSVKVQNYVSVDCAIGIGLATSDYLHKGEYLADASGNVNVIIKGNATSKIAQKVWLADIYAKKWCESKYLSYLQDDGDVVDKDFFLYKTADSEAYAEDNIRILNIMFEEYYLGKVK